MHLPLNFRISSQTINMLQLQAAICSGYTDHWAGICWRLIGGCHLLIPHKFKSWHPPLNFHMSSNTIKITLLPAAICSGSNTELASHHSIVRTPWSLSWLPAWLCCHSKDTVVVAALVPCYYQLSVHACYCQLTWIDPCYWVLRIFVTLK